MLIKIHGYLNSLWLKYHPLIKAQQHENIYARQSKVTVNKGHKLLHLTFSLLAVIKWWPSAHVITIH